MFFDPLLPDIIARSLILSVLAVVWITVVIRLIGLRSFSKMTAIDFVITVAIGSLLAGASQAASWAGFAQPSLAIGFLLGTQYVFARSRRSSEKFEALVQNRPVLLMHQGKILPKALEATRVAEDDLIAKLREANVLDPSDVRAVVLETTGDISVLHGPHLSEFLLRNVRTPE